MRVGIAQRAALLALPLLVSSVHAQDRVSSQELVVRIGEIMGAQEYTFGFVADVAFGPDSTIYVLDGMNAEVRVFDLDGRHLRTFGRKGQGPGEFQLPNRLTVSSHHVTVSDPPQGRIVWFTPGGEHLETSRSPGAELGLTAVLPLRHGVWLGAKDSRITSHGVEPLVGGSRAYVARHGAAFRASNALVVGTFRQDALQLDTIFQFDHGSIMYLMPGRGFGFFTRRWGSGGGWGVAGDSLVVLVDAFQGEIRSLAVTEVGLVPRESLHLPITPEPVSEREWRAVERVERLERDLSPGLHLIGPPFRAQLGEPIVTENGEVWVRRLSTDPTQPPQPRESTYFVLRLGHGSFEERELPPGFSLRAGKGDLLLGVRRTELGVFYVEVWRTHGGAGGAPSRSMESP